MRRTLAIVLAAAAVGGLAGGSIGLAFDGSGSSSQDASIPVAATPAVYSSSTAAKGLTPAQVYRAGAPGVVVITDTQTRVAAGRSSARRAASRSERSAPASCIDASGDIVTNDHVVAGRDRHPRRLQRRRHVPREGRRHRPVHRPRRPPRRRARPGAAPARVRHSASVQVGDPVYAIGNPFGLDRTMTAGIVSATGRDIQSPNGLTIPNAIQTDAPINHGNSGGPLIEAPATSSASLPDRGRHGRRQRRHRLRRRQRHRALGRAAADRDRATPRTRGSASSSPPSTRRCAARARPAGAGRRGRAGRQGQPGREGGAEGRRPAEVAANGARALAGGDAIVGLDGTPVTSSDQLTDAVAAHAPGDRIALDRRPRRATAQRRRHTRQRSRNAVEYHGDDLPERAAAGHGRGGGRPSAVPRRRRPGAAGERPGGGRRRGRRRPHRPRRDRRHQPAVALLDYKLPELDGVAVTNAVVRDGLPTRVLLVSAFTDSGVVYRALETGAAGFVSKEARREQIVDAVLACARGENVVPPDVAAGLVSEIRLRRQDDTPALTPREQEILRLIAEGHSLPEIAKELFLG